MIEFIGDYIVEIIILIIIIANIITKIIKPIKIEDLAKDYLEIVKEIEEMERNKKDVRNINKTRK